MPPDLMDVLTLDEARFGFPGAADFLGPVSVNITRGERWAVVGPNGAGKSTLLRLMAGLHVPGSGRVLLRGQEISTIPIRSRARQVAFMPQNLPPDLDARAWDVVLMGRFPHRSMNLFETGEDAQAARKAMALTGTAGLADRALATLSGGEAQRVHLAAAIAQEAELMLLDEPTASLDLKHQLSIFRILRDSSASVGLTVVVVTHDVNLAAGYCTHILLLHEGRVAGVGPPKEVISPAVLSAVYGVRLSALRNKEDGRAWVVPVDAAS